MYQAFDGAQGVRESGLRNATFAGDATASTDKIFELVKNVAKAAHEVINSGARQLPDHEKELSSAVAELRSFLEANEPTTRRLVQDGEEYPDPAKGEQPAAKPAAAAEQPAATPKPAAAPAKARGKRP